MKAHSHYCGFRVHLLQMIVFPQEDRKFPISALTQPAMSSVNQL